MSGDRHIVIVGGGVIGASVGYFLTKSGNAPRVTILEASKNVAPGASGKSGGFLALDWHSASTSSLAALSYRLHRELAQAEDGANRWGYREVETHQLSVDASRKSRGRPHADWMNPGVFMSTSSIGGGGTTAQVTPGELTLFLATQAQEHGATLRLQTRATGLEQNADGHVTGVKVTSEGKDEMIPATDVVLAAGPWTGKLLSSWFTPQTLPPFLRAATTIEGSRAHSIVIQAAHGHQLTPDCFFSEMRYGDSAGAPEIYLRPRGNAYLCGGTDDEPIPQVADDVSFDPRTTAELQRQAKVLSPEFLDVDSGATLKREQACFLPVSPRTAAPIIGGSTKYGIYVAAGHAVWGINNSLGTGKVMAELLLDGKVSSADISHLQP
ncbi:hypothetical protein MSPP1_003458 [Malassezia sp. CBS 17886]|nr:hypothetical protein MSPP1_003458 [Malassezia sp. CBS 17886]